MQKHSLYTCEVCDDTFLFHDQLHQLVLEMHVGERRFTCDQCHGQRYFASKDNLRHHVRTRHNYDEEKLYSCKRCTASFKWPRGSSKHSWREHRDKMPFNCVLCSACFKDYTDLKQHINKNPIYIQCRASFSTIGKCKHHAHKQRFVCQHRRII